MKLEIITRRELENSNMWRLKNMLPNNQWFNEISMKARSVFFEKITRQTNF